MAARRLLHRGRDARGRRGRERRPLLRLVRARRARAPDRPVGRALHARRRARHVVLAEAADRRARAPALGAAPARDDALGRRGATRPRVARAALAGTERRLVGGARGHPRLDALVHRGGARLGRDPARGDRSRRRPARRLAALHRHARARRARREHARLSGRRRLAQPRRRVLRRWRVGAPDRDARPRPARASRGRAWPGSRPTRRRTATCPSRCRTTCCARSGISPGSRNGARRRPPCSGRTRCTFDCTMPSETVRCAIVGSGLAALATYATLRRGGVRPEEIAVYGTHEDPTEVWRARAAAIRQQRMRSESDGHVAAAAFPGLAVREAARALTVAPLVATRRQSLPPARRGLPASTPSRCARGAAGSRASAASGSTASRRSTTGSPSTARRSATCSSRPVTPGSRSRPSTPARCTPTSRTTTRRRWRSSAPGMAAATEWLNALAAGSEVVSIRRREPLRRALNVPRAFFSKRGLAAFHACERRAPRGDAARALDAVLSARRRAGTSRSPRPRGGRFSVDGTGPRRRSR